MSNMRKLFGLVMLTAFLGVAFAGAALAEEKVGVIDPQKVMLQHPKFEQTQKQIKSVMEKKQNEAKTLIDKESDNNKKQQIFNQKRQEAAAEESKLMDPLFKDIDTAVRTVANAKKITIVVDKQALFYGGTDITEDVIQELKKKNAGGK